MQYYLFNNLVSINILLPIFEFLYSETTFITSKIQLSFKETHVSFLLLIYPHKEMTNNNTLSLQTKMCYPFGHICGNQQTLTVEAGFEIQIISKSEYLSSESNCVLILKFGYYWCIYKCDIRSAKKTEN